MKCQICLRDVKSKKLYKGDFESINVSVVGKGIQIKGHRTCLKNVNNIIVIPNRLRLANLLG